MTVLEYIGLFFILWIICAFACAGFSWLMAPTIKEEDWDV